MLKFIEKEACPVPLTTVLYLAEYLSLRLIFRDDGQLVVYIR